MRKYLAVTLAALAALALAGIATATARAGIQSIDAKLTPRKLPKQKFRPAKIRIDIETQNNDQGSGSFANQPPAATRTIVDFPANMRFNTRAAPRCKVGSAALAGTTTRQAIRLCGRRSIVSVNPSRAVQRVGSLSGWTDYDFVVTAFNGKRRNTLFLHARGQLLPITAVLVGRLKRGPKGYGKSLDVKVPVLAAGGIRTFETTVKHGKFVQARCKSRRMKFRARSTYASGPDTDHTPTRATDRSTCRRKRAHKRRHGHHRGHRSDHRGQRSHR
ncbi:MAG: hypothetical protein R2691_05530 [Solirubrobacterales bacterium]